MLLFMLLASNNNSNDNKCVISEIKLAVSHWLQRVVKLIS